MVYCACAAAVLASKSMATARSLVISTSSAGTHGSKLCEPAHLENVIQITSENVSRGAAGPGSIGRIAAWFSLRGSVNSSQREVLRCARSYSNQAA